MATTNISTALSYFRKTLKNYSERNEGKEFDFYIWYNIDKILDDKDIEKIKNFSAKYNSNLTIIVNGIKYLRPQRTWGDLPEWFRSNNDWHELHKEDSAFIFMNFDKVPDHDETDEEFEARCKEARARIEEHKKDQNEFILNRTEQQLVGMYHLDKKYTDRTDTLNARQKLISSLDDIKKEVPDTQIIVLDEYEK